MKGNGSRDDLFRILEKLFPRGMPGGLHASAWGSGVDEDGDEEAGDADPRPPSPHTRNEKHPRTLRYTQVKTPKMISVYVHVGTAPELLRLTISNDRKGFLLQNAENSDEQFKTIYRCKNPHVKYLKSGYVAGVLQVSFAIIPETSPARSGYSNIFGI